MLNTIRKTVLHLGLRREDSCPTLFTEIRLFKLYRLQYQTLNFRFSIFRSYPKERRGDGKIPTKETPSIASTVPVPCECTILGH